MKNYYAILNLYFGASSADIKKAYYQLARKYHPDKNNGNIYFEEKFKEINEAYAVLSDENKRSIYQAEYTDFLNPKTEITFQPFHPTNFRPEPMQPRGPASDYSVNFVGLRVGIFLAILAACIFLFVRSIQLHKEKILSDKEFFDYTDSINKIRPSSENLFYQSLNAEAAETHDSTMLKSNLDSLKHVFDSIMNEYYK